VGDTDRIIGENKYLGSNYPALKNNRSGVDNPYLIFETISS